MEEYNKKSEGIIDQEKEVNTSLDGEKIKRTIYDENAPYDNVTVGVAGWFFGPIAGAILSYISLKNLGKEYARFVLISGFVLTVLLTYLLIFVFPEVSNLSIGFLWLVYMGIQQAHVKKWAEKNPEKKYKSGFKALGWGIVGGLLLYVTIFISAIFLGSTGTGVDKDISVYKEYPREVSLDDSFDIEVTITNSGSSIQELKSVDIENDFLEGILIKNISPKIKSEYNNFGMYVYEFKENINSGGETKIVFSAKAVKRGDYSGNFDICIGTDITCIYDGVRILVR